MGASFQYFFGSFEYLAILGQPNKNIFQLSGVTSHLSVPGMTDESMTV